MTHDFVFDEMEELPSDRFHKDAINQYIAEHHKSKGKYPTAREICPRLDWKCSTETFRQFAQTIEERVGELEIRIVASPLSGTNETDDASDNYGVGQILYCVRKSESQWRVEATDGEKLRVGLVEARSLLDSTKRMEKGK